MESIWQKITPRPELPILEGDVKCDVCVIGGGIAGIAVAYFLKESGADTILIEADRLCSGTTSYTTAKVTAQHGLIYSKLLRRFGKEGAELYLSSQLNATDKVRELCREMGLSFTSLPSFVYSLTDRRKLEEECLAIQKIGGFAEIYETGELPIKTAGAVGIGVQGMINPLEFCFSLAKGVRAYENTKALELYPGGVLTNRGKIEAKEIVIATHFPVLNKHGLYFLKMYQHRSYTLALKGAASPRGMYVDEDKRGLSFRPFGDVLLLSGGGHRTGKHGGGWHELKRLKEKYYKDSDEIAHSAAQDCMTLDGIPYAGRYSSRTERLYVITGFNKWGMTGSIAAANLVTDMIFGRSNGLEELFSPSRSILRPQLAINAAEALLGWVTPSVPRCPHLGCALKYNKEEHSWDCPCHGSRFTEEGKLINNPATDDKNL